MTSKEKQLRTEIRKILIEHYAVNGLDDLSPREVQRRLKLLEAKAFQTKAKMDKKLLGAKNTTGNTYPNANWALGKPKKSNVSPESKGHEGLEGKQIVKTQRMAPTTTAAKFSVKKAKASKKFGKRIK